MNICKLDIRKAIIKTAIKPHVDGRHSYDVNNDGEIEIKRGLDSKAINRTVATKIANNLITKINKDDEINTYIHTKIKKTDSQSPVTITVNVHPDYIESEFNKIADSQKNNIDVDLSREEEEFKDERRKFLGDEALFDQEQKEFNFPYYQLKNPITAEQSKNINHLKSISPEYNKFSNEDIQFAIEHLIPDSKVKENKEIEIQLYNENFKIKLNDITIEPDLERGINLEDETKWNHFSINANGKKLGYIEVRKKGNDIKVSLSGLYGKSEKTVKETIANKIIKLLKDIFVKPFLSLNENKDLSKINIGKGIGKYRNIEDRDKQELPYIDEEQESDYQENNKSDENLVDPKLNNKFEEMLTNGIVTQICN